MSEYIGTPDVQVILRKRSFQFVTPGDFDLNVSSFYTENSDPSIKSDNVHFIKDLGVAMVKPLLINRSNYVDSSISPKYSYEDVGSNTVDESFSGYIDPQDSLATSPIQTSWNYFVEVPDGAEPESKDEIERRVFTPMPTLTQYYAISHYDEEIDPAHEGQGTSVYYQDAHYKDIYDTWKEGETKWYNGDAGGKYNGPEWETWAHDPPAGAKYPVSWIHQISSADNVEWMLLQKGYNFTNQPFWIDIEKSSIGKITSNDIKGISRLHRYGGKALLHHFTIRIGWNDPISGKWGDVRYIRNRDGYGPYDIVFPIGGSPFIWDHGGHKNDDGDNETNDLSEKNKYFGALSDEISNEEWIFPEDKGKYRIYVMSIRGKMSIQTSWAPGVWVFPLNYDKVTEYTSDKYENFYIPPGKIAILGRGFSFRMSYNPMEFNVYENGVKREPSAKMISQPVQERRDFQGKKGGLLDCSNYNRGPVALDEYQNFLIIPNASNDEDVRGRRQTCSYGCDVVSTPYEGNGLMSKNYESENSESENSESKKHIPKSSPQSSYTSMMIPVKGSDPYSSTFMKDSDNCVYYTQARSPESSDRPVATTRVGSNVGFREDVQLTFDNKIIEIGLNCRKPKIGKHIGDTSERFASPIVWRVKGKHYSPFPDEGTDIDVTALVEKISYDCTSPDFFTVRQNYDIYFLLPKQGILNENYYGKIPSKYLDRSELIKLLTGGTREVEIRLGWRNGEYSDPAGNNKRTVFTGLSNGVPVKNKYDIDKITLKCNDRIQILEDWPILNSPWYDGLNLSDAFMHLCTISGLPKGMFRVNSKRAFTEVLDIGYNLTEPALKFDNDTVLFEAIKVIAKRFWHVVKADSFGRIELTDLNNTGTEENALQAQNAVIDELSLSHPSYVFYMDGAEAPNPFQRIYDSVDINKTINERLTSVEIFSVDRRSNKLVLDNRNPDIEGIENPDSPDFLGYKKPFRQSNPAFGTKEKIQYYKELLERHMLQSPLKVTFTTYGRPRLLPFDIISLQMPNEISGSHFGVYNPAGGASSDLTTYIKLRVRSISGEISLTSDMKYNMTITAEHK